MYKKHNLCILIAPLDWGLGHYIRCVPIIQHLINCGCTVIIGAECTGFQLLQKEFPSLPFVSLPGYRVEYAYSKRLLSLTLLCQLPKIFSTILKEHLRLSAILKEHKIDAVVSDNRFGLWSARLPVVFMTHQLQIKGPNKWVEAIIRKINYAFINKFAVCWIPDYEDTNNIAGTLSHPDKKPSIPIKYIGGLSRLQFTQPLTIIYDIMIILSGPEPQRTVLENILLRDLNETTGKVLLVRGKPGFTELNRTEKDLTIIDHLPSNEMGLTMQQSKIIISRAGYTTIMDLLKLKKKAIVIPTPGQTEQEYLAGYLQKQHICLAFDQSNFNLTSAIHHANEFEYQFPNYDMELYKNVVNEWLSRLHTRRR